MKVREFKNKYRKDICTNCSIVGICVDDEDLTENFTRCNKVTLCYECKIKNRCKTLCPMMKGYINRSITGGKTFLVSMQNIDTIEQKPYIEKMLKSKYTVKEDGVIYLNRIITDKELIIKFEDIPWQAVSPLVAKRIKQHFLEGMTYKEINKAEGKNRHEYKIYKSVLEGLKKLRRRYEHLKYFEEIKENLSYKAQTYLTEYLIKGLTTQQIADKYGISKSRAAFVVARFFKRFERRKNE